MEAYGLYFDDNNKLRALDPEVQKDSHALSDGCKEFLGKFGDFNEVVSEWITSVSKLAHEIETTKTKAVGQQNLLKSMGKEREVKRQQLLDMIQEKKKQKSRLDEELDALKKEEQVQDSFIKRFKDQQ
ncbi:intraflagellar transport protein 20 homolog A-like [Symsagittifera roscoffensis]|uniref:intraflagellar transport protein 20 homolog A-like n=1 Tax=Symsagittifera roscoffensis TaxID=84072 RepID=UPI00307B6FC7